EGARRYVNHRARVLTPYSAEADGGRSRSSGTPFSGSGVATSISVSGRSGAGPSIGRGPARSYPVAVAAGLATNRDSSTRSVGEGENMTTLENRPKTALLVVDVQNGVVRGAHQRDAVVANVGTLVDRARREQVPVVWVQHSDDQLARGSDDWRIVPELAPDDAEPLVEKNYGDSFEDTTLETVLSGLGVGRLVVVGAQTDACIRSTLHGALVRG